MYKLEITLSSLNPLKNIKFQNEFMGDSFESLKDNLNTYILKICRENNFYGNILCNELYQKDEEYYDSDEYCINVNEEFNDISLLQGIEKY